VTALAATTAVCGASACPPLGGTLQVVLEPAAGSPPADVVVAGALAMPSCDAADDGLATTYVRTLTCDPAAPDGCTATFEGLQPGAWKHQIFVVAGEPFGQFQGRTGLLLDRSAGSHTVAWPLYRSVQTVASLDDSQGCVECLRAAIVAAQVAAKPALIQFAQGLTGTIRLVAGLPPLLTSMVTIDGLDTDGVALTRTIDGNGLDAAALRIVGSQNQIIGLRITDVGGDSDVVVLEGPECIDNLLDQVQVVGRATTLCGTNNLGCLIDGVCREPSPASPQGFCGNDAIGIRSLAGAAGPNRIRRALISSARDKGVKVSNGAVAVVEDSVVTGNADGGMQATLSGQLTARQNILLANHGTTSANGLAANGPDGGSSLPAILNTRGNLSIGNALRGISIRSLSLATLRDDFVCGNDVGLAMLDAAGLSPLVVANGLSVTHNTISGIVAVDGSRAAFGNAISPGDNAVAFNGRLRPPTPANFRNQTALPVPAIGNHWEHCGPLGVCDTNAVQALDIFTANAQAPVSIEPAQPTRQRAAARITAIDPPFAAAGDLVHIYGSGFDAIDGVGTSCTNLESVNSCHPMRGNCVQIGRTPAQVVAVTPTMLVVRAPFTCVAPVTVAVRTRWSHGFGRAPFCTLAASDE
jgi:hypothetical protein